jgi:hypothetical protein
VTLARTRAATVEFDDDNLIIERIQSQFKYEIKTLGSWLAAVTTGMPRNSTATVSHTPQLAAISGRWKVPTERFWGRRLVIFSRVLRRVLRVTHTRVHF